MTFRRTAFAIALFAPCLIVRAQQNPTPVPTVQQPTKASIAGTVLKAGSGEPVRKATVTLRPTAGTVVQGPGGNGVLPQANLPQQGGAQQGQAAQRGGQQGQRGGQQGPGGGGQQNQV